MFDARPEAFGSYRVLDEMRAGRTGRVFRAQEPATGAFVVVKVLEEGVPPDRAPLVAAALARLCSAPLDHPSIVAPFAAGLEDALPWIAEPQVDGELLVSVMGRGAAADVPDVLVRVTQLAGALDFAAAAGIRHGALHPRSIIVSGDRTLIAGLGLQQALREAGVDAPLHDDTQVLAAIAGEWLSGTAPPRVRAVLEAAVGGAHQGTALEFAAALQAALRDPQPAIREPEPAVPLVVDPDLRVVEPEPRFADAELRVREPRMSDPEPRVAESGERSAPSMWPPMAAMLAIGLLGGFAAGYLVGQRDATPTPYAAERAVRRPVPPEAPASTSGRDDTDSDVATEVRDEEVRVPPEPATRNQAEGTRNGEQRTSSQQPGTRNPQPGTAVPATMVVDSRPRGARVFVDGRLVGQTPLSLAEVAPGEHAVRIDLVGYQRWVTRVNVVQGERTRVAASLER